MSLYTIPDNAQRTNTPSMYSNGDTEMVDAASAAAHAAQAHAHAHAQHYPPSRILSSVAVAPPSQRRTPHGTIAGSSGSMPRGHGQECSPADAHHQAALQHQSGPTPSTVANAHLGHSLYFIEHLFPSKLWRILDDAERCGYDHVISWVDSGMAFQIREYFVVLVDGMQWTVMQCNVMHWIGLDWIVFKFHGICMISMAN